MIDVKVEYPIPGMVIQSASTYSKFEFRFLAESGSVNKVYYWYGFETVAYPAQFHMNAVTYIYIYTVHMYYLYIYCTYVLLLTHL